jgi:hypothetical protein
MFGRAPLILPENQELGAVPIYPLVLKVVGDMRLTHRAFDVFVPLALDLAQFVKPGFFLSVAKS